MFNSVGLWFPPAEPAPPSYPSTAAFRSVMWLGALTATMTNQLGFIYGEGCEADGCHADMTSQLGLWASIELAPLLSAIRPEFGSTNSRSPLTVAVSSDDVRAKAWANLPEHGGGIFLVVVNLDKEATFFNASIGGSQELTRGVWVAERLDIAAGNSSAAVVVIGAAVAGTVDASTTNVYKLHALHTRREAPLV